MKSNSTVIGVVVCIVCCFCALCIIPHITTSDNDLAGWNPSSMYDGVISPDNSNFTEAVLEESQGGGMAATARVSSTGSRMFHHSSASTMSAQGMGMGSSYAGASVHTTSSAAMSGTGSSISPISTSTATGSMSGSSMGGGAIYATSNSVSPRSGSASGSSLISSSALSAPTASRAAAPMMSASSATSGNPSAMYASNMSSNYGNASYGGYSGGPMGVKGRQNSSQADEWSQMLYDLMNGLYTDATTEGADNWAEWAGVWLNDHDDWDGDGWNDKIEYFNYTELKKYFMHHFNPNGTLDPQEAEEMWQQFVAWIEAGKAGSASHNFRFPIPDGVGVLLVLSLLCVLFTYLRSRDKKILEETENTH